MMTATIANGCHNFERMWRQEFNLHEIIRLQINAGIQSHPALTQFSASASYCSRGKPAARKDADRQIHRITLPASGSCVRRDHFSNWK